MSQQWFEHFFGGLAVEFWLKAAPPPDEAELQFLRQTFAGNELLDLACGAGRYTIPLAKAGYRMTGVDISPDFLAAARKSDADIEWVLADMRDLRWSDRFDGALCFGNSFGYSDPAGTRLFLHGVAAALKKGAPFVLETHMTAESILPSVQAEREMQFGDITFSSRSRYDAQESRLDVDYSFAKGDTRETKLAQYWIYTAREVGAMLREAGFEVTGLYGSVEKEAFKLGSQRALFVCRSQYNRALTTEHKKEELL